MSIEREPSCEDVSEPALLPVTEARRRIASALEPLVGRETATLVAARGRVLATGVRAPHDVPRHTNSAMDGYAIARGEHPGGG